VGGGANFPNGYPWQGGKKVWHDTVYALTRTGGVWEVVGRLPHPLAYGVSATVNGRLVCIGGSDSQRHYAEVFALKWISGRLETLPLPSLPVPLANAAGTTVGATVFICGGSEEPGELAAKNRLFALDLSQNPPAWKELAPCPGKGRILPVAASLDGAFYIAGGAALEPAASRIARVYLRDTWRYRTGAGWQRMADLPAPSVAAPSPAPSLDSTFLIVGGDDGSLAGFQPVDKHPGFPKTILAYDAKADAWRTNGEVPAARATAPTAYWNNHFVILSGEMRPGVRSPEVWTLSPGTAP
jgi:N-acetylneuraminate epimerase